MRWSNSYLIAALVAAACGPGGDDRVEIVVDPGATPLVLDGDLPDRHVALTFDDGPLPETTPAILDVLDAHGVSATFFQVGHRAADHPDITADVVARGHSVGSHSWGHEDLTAMALDDAVADIIAGHEAVGDAAASFFRFPFLASNEALDEAVAELGLAVFHANIVAEDWLTPDADELLDKTLAAVEAEGRGVLLLHDDLPQVVEMLPELLTELKARGYVTVVFRPPDQ